MTHDKSFTTELGTFIPNEVASKFEEARQLSKGTDKPAFILRSGEVVQSADMPADTMAYTFIQTTKSKLVSKWGVFVIG